MDMSQLQDKVIVIIGASKGIGRTTADYLNQHGTKLVLAARQIDQLEQEFDREDVLCFRVDVRNEESVKELVNVTMEQFGRIDVLINSAGVGIFSSILESDTKDFDDMISINLRGTYLTCKYFGRHMAEAGKGHIINLVSIAGTTALPGCGGYSSSKFGVSGLTKVLQAELRQKGVQTTAVIPGSISSSFWDGMESTPDMSQMIPTETIAKQLFSIINQPPGAFIDEITIMPPLGIL
ncbi:SDR family oxidoreductase [Aquibacillus sediminis]|uniref:SDR family oxidoreductase n=1 Tax=Aquibacillus sediminis TaxID=2574734 RepID=UPI001485F95B|nr:SDR family oxidoreductase [Aquibacillus sediminis]